MIFCTISFFRVLIFPLHFPCFVLLKRSSLDILYSHLMFIALLSSLRWYESILFSAVFVRVHSSELYRNILFDTCAEYSDFCLDAFFPSSGPFFVNVYSSVFVSFIFRPHSSLGSAMFFLP